MTKSFARLAGSLICLLSVAFACQTTKDVENEVIILDTREAVKIEKELKLSDIAQSIEYVKLETNPDCLISSGTSLIVGKKYILFLNRQPAKLFLFERSGRFLREIGKLGKGPGEYERPSDIDLNSTEDKVLVTSAGYPCKINEYAITGEFIRSGELPHWTEGGVQYMPTGNFIYVQGRPFTDSIDYPRIIGLDQDFQNPRVLYQTDSKRNPNQMAGYYSRTLFARQDDGFAYKEAIQDTVFHFDWDGNKPDIRFVLKMGENRPQYYALTIEQAEAYGNNIDMVNEFSQYVFLLGRVNGNRAHMAYNKKTGEFFKLKKQSQCLGENGYSHGLVNDLTGSGPFWYWEGADLRINALTSLLSVVDLKELIETDCFNDDSRLSTTQYRDELRGMVEASSIDDNPIVRIIHLK